MYECMYALCVILPPCYILNICFAIADPVCFATRKWITSDSVAFTIIRIYLFMPEHFIVLLVLLPATNQCDQINVWYSNF